MKTPDGKQFDAGAPNRPLAIAGAAAQAASRQIWRFTVLVARGIGKVIATIWRLAGALDSALWRGTKLFAHWLWRLLSLIGRLMFAAGRDLLRWLPSRSGRAYTAFSAFVLVIALLAIADELRVSPSDLAGQGDTPRAPVDLQDPILARIEGRYVHLSEVRAAAVASGALRDDEVLTPQDAFGRELVEAYVEQRLLSRAAIDDGLARSPDVTRQLGAARDRILAAAYMENRIKAVVTDDAVKRLYDRESDVTRLGDEVRARQIVVATGEEAQSVMTALQAGGSFEDLARSLSIDRATATIGGDLGYFTKDMMTPALASAAFATPVGEYAPPFESEFGWHVIQVVDRRPTAGVPLGSVEDNIRRFLRRRTIADTLAALKEQNEVVYYQAAPPAEKASAPPELRTGEEKTPGG
ncbi:MAG TPA: peptidylprolyl isomerase [Parvularculaceae bacterium]|nr:peptidylprolyl isomerase [Parvularculaceae bacterium]